MCACVRFVLPLCVLIQSGLTAISWAIQHRHARVVDFLLKHNNSRKDIYTVRPTPAFSHKLQDLGMIETMVYIVLHVLRYVLQFAILARPLFRKCLIGAKGGM